MTLYPPMVGGRKVKTVLLLKNSTPNKMANQVETPALPKFDLATPIDAFGTSDVFLMQRKSIPVQAWLYVKFGEYSYTSKPESKKFEGIEFKSESGETVLILSIRDLQSEAFNSFCTLSKNEKGQITGVELLKEGIVFGVSVEVTPMTESDKQIGLAAIEDLKKTDPNKYMARLKGLQYDKKRLEIVGQR
jgi:hypothetical protein